MLENLVQLLLWYTGVLFVDAADLRHHLLEILELIFDFGHLTPATGGQLVDEHGGFGCDEAALANNADERAGGCSGALHDGVDRYTTGLDGVHGREGGEHGPAE